MFADTTILVLAALLTWLMLITASALRTHALHPGGIGRAVSNRDNLPEATPLAGRADRAARNMLENLLLFLVLVAAAHFAGRASAQAQIGANIFFWSRLVYWPAYLAGMPALRTLCWSVSIVGLAMIALAVV